MTATFGAPASAISAAAAPSTAPNSTHGTRRPRREVVRSLKAPKRGLATSETAAPAPVTSAEDGFLVRFAEGCRLLAEENLAAGRRTPR